MSFKQREINLIFSIDGKELYLNGLRSQAIISNPGGNNAVASLQLIVYGMTLEQMNKFSSTGSTTVSGALALQRITITVLAGNKGEAVGQVFSGGVLKSYIDFSSVPEVSFVCSAQAGLWEKANPVAANSWQGTQNAETLIESLVAQMGKPWTFKNNGAHAVIQNQYVYGSIINQIQKIAKACSLPLSIDGNVVSIWPNDGTRDSMVIDVSAETGLVGYPTYNDIGFSIKTEFNQNLINGRTVNLKTIIPKANGKAPIQDSTHEISTLSPDGPWFTTVILSPSAYVPKN
jgi:hypothetical protein